MSGLWGPGFREPGDGAAAPYAACPTVEVDFGPPRVLTRSVVVSTTALPTPDCKGKEGMGSKVFVGLYKRAWMRIHLAGLEYRWKWGIEKGASGLGVALGISPPWYSRGPSRICGVQPFFGLAAWSRVAVMATVLSGVRGCLVGQSVLFAFGFGCDLPFMDNCHFLQVFVK